MGKVLFIRGGAVGDFILTLPAIQLVREQLPDNQIEILGYPAITEIARQTGLADETRSIEDARLALFFVPGADLDRKWCDYFCSFDLIVSYLYDPDDFFSSNLERIGVRHLIRAPFKPDDSESSTPAALQLAKPLEQLALFLEQPSLQLAFPEPTLETKETSSPTRKIALHPGSGSPSKNWSFESWVEVIRHLREKHQDAEFLITCGEAESERIEIFCELLNSAMVEHRLIQNHSLTELGSLYRSVDLYLGHDSGISHLAAAAGATCLLLFGQTRPEVWSPPHDHVQVIRSDDGTLAGITVPQVVEELHQLGFSLP